MPVSLSLVAWAEASWPTGVANPVIWSGLRLGRRLTHSSGAIAYATYYLVMGTDHGSLRARKLRCVGGCVMAVTDEDINVFLWCSYIPRPSLDLLQPILDDPKGFRDLRRWMSRAADDVLVAEGQILLKRAFQEQLRGAAPHHHVPLSGGIDSRVILAYLLHEVPADNITTVTYGLPGAYDFEYGRAVARMAKVRHEPIDLDRLQVTLADLHAVCTGGGDWTPVLRTFYSWHGFERGPENATRWSGFLGDPLAGSHFQLSLSKLSYLEACSRFLRINQWTRVSKVRLSHPDIDLASLLPAAPPIEDPATVSYPEQLDLAVRQTSWIRKAVVPPGTRAPFLSSDWTRYMLAAPPELRMECRLYYRIAARLNPPLFELRTKSVRGHRLFGRARAARYYAGVAGDKIEAMFRSLRGKPAFNKYLNFIDPQRSFESHPDLRLLLREAIMRLQDSRRLMWLDIPGLYREFLGGNRRLHDVMELLLSLDANIFGPHEPGKLNER